MLSAGLIEFLLYLLVPVILVKFLRNRKEKDNSLKHSRALSLGDYVAYFSLAGLAALYMLSATYRQPPNIFKRIDAAPQYPCQLLLQRLGDYARNNPHILPSEGIPDSTGKPYGATGILDYEGSEYGRMAFLVDRFCAFDEDRSVYLKFGEEAFLNSIASDFGPDKRSARIAMPGPKGSGSNFMTEFRDTAYLLYAASAQFLTYLPAFVLVGLLTTPLLATNFAPSRPSARPWGVITLSTLFFADLYWLCTTPTSTELRTAGAMSVWILSPDRTDPMFFYADAAAYSRQVFLGLNLIVFMAMDYMASTKQTDVQLLKTCIEEQGKTLVAAKNHTILETSVLLSARLREKLVAVWKKEQLAREGAFSDKTFAAKYDDVATSTKSKQWAEHMLPAAISSFKGKTL
ncbi:hypothetical protein LPJ60_003618 [Coemansia sp. RSA 2675]|uniref:Uncharacterized protein n=1 Tax=Coemansia linderi TaxID=2663919 RepID=A0ACC1KG04_9FUNG|nr:hypothetical protein LPJ60_003618 [Coemansia sp. RSA 2675]KAJ2789240.1 hypothetical protein GGI18_002517 [Coemansia linderi]